MKAALVTSFDSAPRFADVDAPIARGEHDVIVDVLASGLHPRVLSQANGSHYTSTDELPLIPGVDGVGRDSAGTMRYFVLPDTPQGAMAEQTVIDARRSVALPDSSDPVAVAAAMNPAMSSWIALRRRTAFIAGQSVLVLGATGNAGRMAVQVARHLGASRIVAAGRDAAALAALPALGATHTVSLAGAPEEVAARLAEAAADIDVVIDYLWGEPTVAAMSAIVPARPDAAATLTWIQIGSMAGSTAAIPSAALRASGLTIVGSGQGSVSARDIVGELPSLVQAIADGVLTVDAVAVPLADVEAAWAATPTSSERRVIVP